ncbi:unnamed protein product [Clonostachys rhizophaga]|uniref:Uncharacterized protein n=1 Tax=Clonostachys rhizophaga TaxID=160324 RepID=A0A9N9YGS1_9HYPO|nr:unnamed protein product [Clonostachys rhizophaga]
MNGQTSGEDPQVLIPLPDLDHERPFPRRARPCHPTIVPSREFLRIHAALAMEGTKHGIRVNSLSSGFLKTALNYSANASSDWDLKMKYYGGMLRPALLRELRSACVISSLNSVYTYVSVLSLLSPLKYFLYFN